MPGWTVCDSCKKSFQKTYESEHTCVECRYKSDPHSKPGYGYGYGGVAYEDSWEFEEGMKLLKRSNPDRYELMKKNGY